MLIIANLLFANWELDSSNTAPSGTLKLSDMQRYSGWPLGRVTATLKTDEYRLLHITLLCTLLTCIPERCIVYRSIVVSNISQKISLLGSTKITTLVKYIQQCTSNTSNIRTCTKCMYMYLFLDRYPNWYSDATLFTINHCTFQQL